jgi:hypothetical protein
MDIANDVITMPQSLDAADNGNERSIVDDASMDVANDVTTMPQSLDAVDNGNERLVQLLIQKQSLVLDDLNYFQHTM